MAEDKVMVTGGAGFIGSNIAKALLECDSEVIVFDNLSRKGVSHNIEWLKQFGEGKLHFINADLRDFSTLKDAVKGCETIFHIAGQTAVTTSVINPREDFEINAVGTLNVLEAARILNSNVIFCSTNKVYGDNVNKKPLKEGEKRYDFADGKGIDEDFSIDAAEHSPYGVSKLTADQYVRDYANVYGINTVVNRMSCIYGTRQFGTTDQGWVAHFVRCAIKNEPVIIYGDGKQIRDVLFITDLVDLFLKESDNISKFKGEVFNVGGGPNNTLSLSELIDMLEKLTGNKVEYTFEAWRPADQKVYYSDITKAGRVLGWAPKISPEQGVRLLFKWTKEHINIVG